MLQFATPPGRDCDIAAPAQRRAWVRCMCAAALSLALAPTRVAAGADAKPPGFEFAAPARMGPGVWAIWGQSGDADASNRGHVVNLLAVLEGSALWVIGSGPSPVFGAALDRLCRTTWPGLTLELISPWAHPESVLGGGSLRHRRHWAHVDVAQQMASRCPGCLQRLLQRLGPAAEDFPAGQGAEQAIQLPTHTVRGAAGGLGPFEWWALPRGDDVTVTVWRHRRSGVVFAPGLLWGQVPPDGRDADIAQLTRSTQRLLSLAPPSHSAVWVGQQGRAGNRLMAQQAADYWTALAEAITQAQDKGEDGITPSRQLPACPAAWLDHPHHGLNWQRAWRQAESRWLQRSLR